MAAARRMPAEWEPHRATWIAWPHQELDYPGKLEIIRWVYVEIARILTRFEPVEIVCRDEAHEREAADQLRRAHVTDNFRFHKLPTDRAWLRDSAPTAVATPKGVEWIAWHFNAWAKYSNYALDREVPALVARVSGRPMSRAVRPDGKPFVLEGGAIETDGEGTLLTTEECLLSDIQERNPGLSRSGYEGMFREYLGIDRTVWLGRSCEGDDTHGHIDDVARFTAPGKVVLSFESDGSDPNHEYSKENLERLKGAVDARGRKLEVVTIPMPRPLHFEEWRLPASYANFYVANGVVIAPTFNDPNDRIVLSTLAECFPGREVIGIHCGDLVLGFGTLHCLTQQEPR